MVFKQKLQQRAIKNTEGKVVKKFSVFDVILAPLVTEKSYKSQETGNKYFFRVHKNANKNDVKNAMEKVRILIKTGCFLIQNSG
jgi:hypothetical protein